MLSAAALLQISRGLVATCLGSSASLHSNQHNEFLLDSVFALKGNGGEVMEAQRKGLVLTFPRPVFLCMVNIPETSLDDPLPTPDPGFCMAIISAAPTDQMPLSFCRVCALHVLVVPGLFKVLYSSVL